jgi:hypothetical protein
VSRSADAEMLATERPVLLPADCRSWLVTALSVAMTYLIASRGMFVFLAQWQVPLLVGVVSAAVASTYLQAGIVALALTALLQMLALPQLPSSVPFTPADWMLGLALAGAFSLGVGWIKAIAERNHRPVSAAIAVLMVVWILVTLWSPLFAGGLPSSGYGTLQASIIRDVPQPGQYVNDDAIYRRVFYLMHDGVPYYPAFRQAWDGLKHRPAPPNTVVAYRLPTMYWLWNLLPRDAFLIVTVFLAFASLGCVAAAFITGQVAGARFAPLASLALATFAMGSAGTVYVTYVDLPAACLALVGIAMWMRARVTADDRWLWAAAAVCAAAALTREILVYLVVFATLSAALEERGRRVRSAVPWLAALCVFGVGYAAHTWAVIGLIVPGSGSLSYMKGSPAYALDALRRFSDLFTWGGLLLPALFLLGVGGAWAASRRIGRPFAVFAMAALVLPVVAMGRFGNPSIDAMGNQVNYWGNLFVPLALALWPAWAVLVPE